MGKSNILSRYAYGRFNPDYEVTIGTEFMAKNIQSIQKIINDAHEQALAIIRQYKDDVELIAQTLIEHEQITAEEIDYLLEHRHLKKDEVVEAKPEEKAKEEKPAEIEKDSSTKEEEGK